MKSFLSAIHDRAVVIHDRKREDRKASLDSWMALHTVQIPLMQAIMNKSDGKRGCFESHKLVASSFADSPLQDYYLVLEDDCLPTRNWNNEELVTSVISVVKEKSVDLLYLGGLPLFGHRTTKHKYVNSGRCLQTHALLVSPRAAKHIKHLFYEKHPIDTVLSQTSILRSAFVDPPLFAQSDTKSDIRTNVAQAKWFSAGMASWIPTIWRHVVMNEIAYASLASIVILIVVFYCMRAALRAVKNKSG